MKVIALLCIGATAGAACRYYVGLWAASRFGTTFPYGTLLINITGCLIMGIFGTLALERSALIPPELRLMIAVGFVGSYTTFSTFGFETIRLLQEGDFFLAASYVLGSNILGLLAVYLGSIGVRSIHWGA